MNNYQNTSDYDYTVINNITYEELVCNQEPINYSMLFFCIKQNRSNKLTSRLFCFLYRLKKNPQLSYKELLSYSVNVIILFLILLSMIVILLAFIEIRIELILACIPVVLLLYVFVQVALDSLTSITIKVADFKVGTSEVNKALIKKGYNKILLKQYIVNVSSNRYGLVHIQYTGNYANDINGLSVKIWPFSQMLLCYNVICQYVKQISMIKTYYFKRCDCVDIYDDKDRCCINHLNSIANSIIEIHNKAINIDRVIIFRNNTPIYCNDAI